jgi:hypothetical protein
VIRNPVPHSRPIAPPPTEADYVLAAEVHHQPTVLEQLLEIVSALPVGALVQLVSASLALVLLIAVLVVGGWLAGAASARWQAFTASRTTPSVTTTPMSIPSTPTAEAAAPAFCGQARVTGRRVNVREAPTRQSAVLGQVQQGDVVELLCDAPQVADGYTWQHIQIPGDMQVGWIATAYLAPLR